MKTPLNRGEGHSGSWFRLGERCVAMRWCVMVGAMITLVGLTAHAAEISISMAQEKWPAGQRIEFSFYTMPSGQDVPTDALSDHLACTLESGGKTQSVTARRVPGEGLSGVGGIAGMQNVLYAFDAPDGIIGTVQLRIADLRVPAILFEVVAPEEKSSSHSRYPTLDSLFALYQPYLGDIAAYQPMSFLVGTDPSKSKFQISFKYRFFNPESDFVDSHPWVKGFYFAYTQTSFWDLKDSSAPFEDTSYKPELFWVSRNLSSADSS